MKKQNLTPSVILADTTFLREEGYVHLTGRGKPFRFLFVPRDCVTIAPKVQILNLPLLKGNFLCQRECHEVTRVCRVPEEKVADVLTSVREVLRIANCALKKTHSVKLSSKSRQNKKDLFEALFVSKLNRAFPFAFNGKAFIIKIVNIFFYKLRNIFRMI